jgi:hypothetical protein
MFEQILKSQGVLMFPNIFFLNWEIGKGQFGLV